MLSVKETYDSTWASSLGMDVFLFASLLQIALPISRQECKTFLDRVQKISSVLSRVCQAAEEKCIADVDEALLHFPEVAREFATLFAAFNKSDTSTSSLPAPST